MWQSLGCSKGGPEKLGLDWFEKQAETGSAESSSRSQQVRAWAQNKTGHSGEGCSCNLHLIQLHELWLLLWRSVWDHLVFPLKGTASPQSSILLLRVDLNVWTAIGRSWLGYKSLLEWLGADWSWAGKWLDAPKKQTEQDASDQFSTTQCGPPG